jgi:cytochrome c-type biogenesis protein CcmH
MRTLRAILAISMLALAAIPHPGHAVEPDEVLADPVLEARARDISAELRCVVCQNQSIDDSDADIARDLRLLVRERLVAGDSDEQVMNYIVARYGDFVLLRPPFQPNTLVLWLGPPIMAIVIATLAVMNFRSYQRRRGAGSGLDPLSPQDRAELDALVERIAATTKPPARRSTLREELEAGLSGREDLPPDPDDDGGDSTRS